MSDRCLIVLGMHRSGTSCLTGTIEQWGVNLGEVFTENPHNRKGNRESAEVQALNNDVLATNCGAWNAPPAVASWDDMQRQRRDTVLLALKASSRDWWGFKDPRVVFTLPFWLEAIAEPAFIGTYRHPYRVACSLHQRDRMPLEAGYALWLAYNTRLLAWQDQFGFDLVDFDVDDDVYNEEVSVRLKRIGLAPPTGETFFDPALRHQSGTINADDNIPAEVLAVYQELKRRHALEPV